MPPEVAWPSWRRVQEKNRKKKKERVHTQFAQQPAPMTMPESTNANYGQAPPESIQKTSSMLVPFLEIPNSRNGAESSQKASLTPAPLLETANHKQDHDQKIEAWNKKKQDIITKYTVSKWTHT